MSAGICFEHVRGGSCLSKNPSRSNCSIKQKRHDTRSVNPNTRVTCFRRATWRVARVEFVLGVEKNEEYEVGRDEADELVDGRPKFPRELRLRRDLVHDDD